MKGWVYIIVNASMPGLVKVGFSLKDPQIRADELNHTGTPHPYEVEYEALVDDPLKIEQSSHQLLTEVRERKEWFRCDTQIAVSAIRKATSGKIFFEQGRALNSTRAAPESSDTPTVVFEAPKRITRRNYGGEMQYVCEHCGSESKQPDSHMGHCSVCGRSGFSA